MKVNCSVIIVNKGDENLNIHIIQHVPFENPGLILEWIEEKGHTYEIVRTYNQEPIPSSEEVDFLVVLGGPMSANDSDEWIAEERQLIKEVVEQGKAMFGICLGAQQLAKAFGNEVVSSPKEVGWGKVKNTHTGADMTVLHWHGEGFTLPENAEKLFSTPLWENQGFRFENAIGLQFHFETTKETVAEIVEADNEFLKLSVFKTSPEETKSFDIPEENKEILFELLDELQRAYALKREDKCYFIDGYGGSPAINWLDTEANELKQYFEVQQVPITNPELADVKQWDKDLEEAITDIENSYFICHSLGCITLLRYLLRHQAVPKGCILVSPFQQTVKGFPEFGDYFDGVEIDILSKKLKNSLVISAENDAIIPWQYSQTVARKLHVPFLLLPEGNHFRASDGIVEFTEVSNFALQHWGTKK